MRVNEIFYSICGETSFAGLPCIFVRLTGCNLRCSYCDTKYAYKEGGELSIKQIIERIKSFNTGDEKCFLVCITGGEPLLQTDIEYLIMELSMKGFTILIETNGSVPLNFRNISMSERLRIIMDYKLNSSNCIPSNDDLNTYEKYQSTAVRNIEKLSYRDELKFIIRNYDDFEEALRIINETKPKAKILFSPAFGEYDAKILAEQVKNSNLNKRYPYSGARVQLQLHKYIWDSDTRGV